MTNLTLLGCTFLLLTSHSTDVSSARILAILPNFVKSHFFVFEPLLKALSARGHDMHVVSQFPQEKAIPNYTDISLKGLMADIEVTGGLTFDQVTGNSPVSFFGLGHLGTVTCESFFKHPNIQKLLQSQQTFDLIIYELFNIDCVLGFADKFKSPHIALGTNVLMSWASKRFGNPDNPAYIPMVLQTYSDHMNLQERVENTLHYLAAHFLNYCTFSEPAQRIAAQYFGKSMSPIDEIAKNTSLMLVNSHPSLNGPRPLVPSIVEVAGIHVQPPKKLSEDLDRWINESSHGVVYFSMGSMLRAETFPNETRAALMEAFAELPQRVLWKWEADSLPGQPANVRVGKWLPQRDILNHPNVRVFMTHCGLLGVIEAVTSGVPMVGIPMFGDQHTNLKSLVRRGVAVHVDYADISKESVLKALRSVLEDSSYRENAERLSRQFLDRPMSPMDTAIYWTEHVIRHRGDQHLRSAAVKLEWYQLMLLDVAVVLLLGALTVLFIVYFIVRKIYLMFAADHNHSKSRKPKQQ